MSTTPISTEVARRFCRQCGHEVRPQATFCGTCGQTAVQPPPTPSFPEPSPPSAGAAGPAGKRPWLIVALAALVLAAIAVPVVLVAHPFGGHISGGATASGPAASGPATTGPATSGPTASSPATTAPASAPPLSAPLASTPPGSAPAASAPLAAPASLPTDAPGATATVQEAAAGLAALLAQSVADRAAIHQAYDDVLGCGPDLDVDAQVFQNAAASRQQLVSQLATLFSGSGLPPQLQPELSGAWQASAAVDRDYAQWARDEDAGTCVPDDTANPNVQAASGPNQQATQDKLAFTRLWNQLAVTYGLTQYDQGQL